MHQKSEKEKKTKPKNRKDTSTLSCMQQKPGKKRNKTKTYVYNHQNHMNENNIDSEQGKLQFSRNCTFRSYFKRDHKTFIKINVYISCL